MSEVNYTEQNPWILPSGRKLWRHSNGEGCVLEFDMYGKIVQLYVPDAKYRDFSSKLLSLNTGGSVQLHSPVLIWNANNYLFDTAKEISEPFTEIEFLTDSQLQTKLDSFLINNTFSQDFSGKDGTDAVIASLENLTGLGIYDKAASYARSLIPTGLSSCNLPNLYELVVIWLESDNIDSIDPTITEYPSTRLGSPNRFSNYDLWCCSEVQYISSDISYFFGIDFNRYGYISYSFRDSPNKVLPVLELSIIDPNAPKHKLITKVVVVDKGQAYETKGVSLGESEVLTTLTSLVQEYQNTYDELNQKVTALETKYNQGKVKIVESMMELKNNPEENMLYINDEVKAIVDDGSGIIPKAYISDGSEVTLKEVERKEEDPNDGNEYIGYVNKAEFFTFNIIPQQIDTNTIGYSAATDPSQDIGTIISNKDGIGMLYNSNQSGINHLVFGVVANSTFSNFCLEIGKQNTETSMYELKATRLDTNLSKIIGYSSNNPTEDYYITDEADANVDTSTPFFTSDDIGKTIQIKIEVA